MGDRSSHRFYRSSIDPLPRPGRGRIPSGMLTPHVTEILVPGRFGRWSERPLAEDREWREYAEESQSQEPQRLTVAMPVRS